MTVIVNVTYDDEVAKVKDFIQKEQSPLFFNLEDSGIVRFEWFLNEEENSGTLIEVFENANAFQTLGSKVLGSPINIKFNELFSIESLTVLGQIPEDFKSKLQPMNPQFKLYSGGISVEWISAEWLEKEGLLDEKNKLQRKEGEHIHVFFKGLGD